MWQVSGVRCQGAAERSSHRGEGGESFNSIGRELGPEDGITGTQPDTGTQQANSAYPLHAPRPTPRLHTNPTHTHTPHTNTHHHLQKALPKHSSRQNDSSKWAEVHQSTNQCTRVGGSTMQNRSPASPTPFPLASKWGSEGSIRTGSPRDKASVERAEKTKRAVARPLDGAGRRSTMGCAYHQEAKRAHSHEPHTRERESTYAVVSEAQCTIFAGQINTSVDDFTKGLVPEGGMPLHYSLHCTWDGAGDNVQCQQSTQPVST